MAGSINSQSNFGSFVPTTNTWDRQQLETLNIDPQLKELLIRLYQNVNTIALSLNTRDAGYYAREEFINGQIYFPNPSLDSTTPQAPTLRQVFRMVVNFGALPNSAAKSVAHGIDVVQGYSFTRIYGTSSKADASVAIPLPFASFISGANNLNVELGISATDVVIITDFDYSAYVNTYIVIEYIKS